MTVLAAVVMMWSCNSREITYLDDSITDPDGSVAVQFVGGGQSAVKSGVKPAVSGTGGNAWDTDDPVGIYMVAHSQLLATSSIADNVSYKATSAGTLTGFEPVNSAVRIYYPMNGDEVNFIAYHPYISPVTAHKIPVDVSDQSDQEDIDLLYATNTNANSKATAGAVNLLFAHQLAKLALTVKKGENMNDLSGLTVSIEGMNTTADFDLEDGSLDNEGGVDNITPLEVTAPTGSGNDGVYEAILLPVAALDGNHVIKFAVGGKTYSWALAGGAYGIGGVYGGKLEAGSQYSYEVTINAYSLTVSGAITGWYGVMPPDWMKENWTIADKSTEWDDTFSAAANLIDGNKDTYWHTTPENDMPQAITIDLKSSFIIRGVKVWNRQDQSGSEPKNIVFQVSEDYGIWTLLMETNMEQRYDEIDLPAPVPLPGRYLRIYINEIWSSEKYTYLAEITLY